MTREDFKRHDIGVAVKNSPYGKITLPTMTDGKTTHSYNDRCMHTQCILIPVERWPPLYYSTVARLPISRVADIATPKPD